jgi:hypothetical protein
MTEEQAKEYLKNRGCPERVWRYGGAGLIRRWREFVAEIENGGYSNCCIEDYWNDLDLRELIHDIGFEVAARESDERFAAILTATNIKHWHTDRNTSYDFWNYGYPKNASGYFLEDVQRHILRRP